jgi:MerR family transcriptional regulator, redox-sensitive transcriptional activator SoxR
VDAQAPFTSSEMVGIGEAARRLRLAPSAIRYYEAEGLLDSPRGPDGRRRYGPEELRTLAFIAVGRELGLGVAGIRDALHPGPGGWSALVDAQVALLDAQIARAQRAKEMLLAGRDCAAPEPVRDCPNLRAALDALVAGAPLPPPGAGHDDPGSGNATTDRDG